MLYKFLTWTNYLLSTFSLKNAHSFRHSLLNSINWLPLYFARAHKLWQEGLYSDHLQKKVLDKFVRKVIIFSNNLFSEGLVFRRVVDAYWTLITSPAFLKLALPFNSPVFNFIWLISFLFLLLFLVIIYGVMFLQLLPGVFTL
jgi:hypothetical protein